ncbi:MAG TPA: MarR family transcriptional regulator [Thermoanaerobaculia bacterium]|nr:MarR family transcriptional regulator [Thermoanaerobaculia bacterium]HUM31233.1 MarR family transcriptional regulator [Thermoanaerobaculia bacterium]HXK69587.1 MarR family transcriptional regulator [Thermoanaerobaculia bacterium]
MSLKEELGFPNPITTPGHETLLSIFVTSGILAKEGDRLLRPLGLTESQFNVLMLLEHQSNGSLDQVSIGRMLVVNRSNVTGLIDRMEREGLVERFPDPVDRRIKQVRMTRKGKEILSRAQLLYIKGVQQAVTSLPDKDQNDLCRILETIRRTITSSQKKED